MAAKRKAQATKKTPRRGKKIVEPATRGLAAEQVKDGATPKALAELTSQIEADGGAVLATYREPLGGKWVMLAALPIDQVRPAPFQRDLSPAHVERLAGVLERLGRYLDPIIVVRARSSDTRARSSDVGSRSSDVGSRGWEWWTPNGSHRLAALTRLGARTIIALVVPEPEIARQILALNTEKAPNLKDRSLEVLRLARELATLDPQREADFALEFEEASLLTLGLCYEQQPRFSGSVYQSALRRVDTFLDAPLPRALATREQRAAKVLELDRAVGEAVAALKGRGFDSPYLKAFVMARVNYLRFVKGDMPAFDAALDKMIAAAQKFDPGKVKADQVAQASGPPEE